MIHHVCIDKNKNISTFVYIDNNKQANKLMG